MNADMEDLLYDIGVGLGRMWQGESVAYRARHLCVFTNARMSKWGLNEIGLAAVLRRSTVKHAMIVWYMNFWMWLARNYEW